MSQGRSLVTDDTAEALVINPANLAWLPAPEMRFDWVGCPASAVKVGCGEALGACATPLFWGLSTSLRLELVTPSTGDHGRGLPLRRLPVRVAQLGRSRGGWASSASFGLSFDHSYSNDAYLDSLNGVTGGLSLPAQHALRLLAPSRATSTVRARP